MLLLTRSRPFSIDDFRSIPEVRPALEYFGGRVIQKVSPKLPHSIIQLELGVVLLTYSRAKQLGRAYSELRCTFRGDSHVFDLCFFSQDRLPDPTSPADRDQIEVPPDLAIEILSPGQTVGELKRKLRSAIRRGVRVGWLVDEARRHVHVLRSGRKPRVLEIGDVLDGEDVLPGFSLSLDEMFSWVAGN